MTTAFQAISGVANACQILPNVVTGGQPTADHLKALKEAGGEIVLDLRDPMEPRPVDEAALVRELGMEYINIPVRAGSLDDTTLEQILGVLRGAGERTVFFHCGSGSRVGGALIPYFILDQGLEEQDAVDQAMRVGLRSAEYMEWGLEYARRNQRLPSAVVSAGSLSRSQAMHFSDSCARRRPVFDLLSPRELAPVRAKPSHSTQRTSTRTCAPCKDFFQFANGGWLKRSEIPGDLPRWGSFNELQEQNYAALQEVLTEAARNAPTAPDPNTRKLGTFYGTCMDSAAVESAGITPLKVELDQIAAIQDRRGVETAHRQVTPAWNSSGLCFRVQTRRQEEHPHDCRGVSGRAGHARPGLLHQDGLGLGKDSPGVRPRM